MFREIFFLVISVLMGSRAAILDPMTAMRDDISRIKVMMETVGGMIGYIHSIIINNILINAKLLIFIRANGAFQRFVPEQIGDSFVKQRHFIGPHRQVKF